MSPCDHPATAPTGAADHAPGGQRDQDLGDSPAGSAGGTVVMGAAQDIAATLVERGSRYGVFADHARITQDIKRAMATGNWSRLKDDQRECLEMLAHKIGRILNGDPDYHDSWHDIVGYAKLVADRLAAQPGGRP